MKEFHEAQSFNSSLLVLLVLRGLLALFASGCFLRSSCLLAAARLLGIGEGLLVRGTVVEIHLWERLIYLDKDVSEL